MPGQRVSLQVVDKPAHGGMTIHPLKLGNQFFIGEVMTEQRRKKDIRFPFFEGYLAVIGVDPCRIIIRPSPAGDFQAVCIAVDAGYAHFDVPSPAPPAQDPQVIPAPASDLAKVDPLPATGKGGQASYTDGMSPQPGIDKIQLQHIPFDIGKGQPLPVQQFLFIAAL